MKQMTPNGLNQSLKLKMADAYLYAQEKRNVYSQCFVKSC